MKTNLKKIKQFKVGEKVFWKWLGRAINGQVLSVHLESISKVIKGKTIKRNGSAENPAYVVQSDAGNIALKLQSELSVFEKKTDSKKVNSPKMFTAE